MRNVDYFYRWMVRNVFVSDRLRACLVIIITHFSLLIPHYSAAQTLKDAFKQMPDSLMPYLTTNDRLDFIDFLDSGMKAEVTNQMGGTSEMTALTADSLSIRMSESLRVDMLLLDLNPCLQTPDSCLSQVIVVAETFLADSVYGSTVCKAYSVDWQPVTQSLPLSDVQRKRLERLDLQNILKWSEDKLNNR